MHLSEDGRTLIQVDPEDIPADGYFDVPSTVIRIDGWAFLGCTRLTQVTLPKGLTEVGPGSFFGCTGLAEIILPEILTKIEWDTFFGCTGLKKVTLPEMLMTIERGTFASCTGLTEVTIPKVLTHIDEKAFSGCTGLQFILINTQSKVEFNRIKERLPENLKSKVIATTHGEALFLQAERLGRDVASQMYPLAGGASFFRTKDELKLSEVSVESDNSAYQSQLDCIVAHR
jgi:hypothetical protein